MQALVPVAKHGQPIDTVPLCQCKCHSSATGNLNFQWHKKTTQNILISSPYKLRVNAVSLGAEILNLLLAVLSQLSVTQLPLKCQSNTY